MDSTKTKELEERIAKLESEIKQIKARNHKVEGDKAWETSWLRRILIIIFTYIFAVLWLTLADTANPFLGAIVPCAGFLLSTLTIYSVKSIYIKNRK
ncbi:hypothetical protein IKD67_03995 [Candidatus Saccharibacteria bacterium]|nr:hypothetical protein [Candidatus Saccharibacteria bacterium]